MSVGADESHETGFMQSSIFHQQKPEVNTCDETGFTIGSGFNGCDGGVPAVSRGDLSTMFIPLPKQSRGRTHAAEG